MTEQHIDKIQAAEQILNDYGKILANITDMGYAHPVSLLPHTKDQIKDAIQLILKEIGDENKDLRNSLFEAYVVLAKFIPDEDVGIVEDGQTAITGEASDTSVEDVDNAAKLINSIKLEMESLTEDLKIFLS
ncbi:MAG: hypothetical protein OEZ33_01045 [Gammaproteobacteria bacterium]|nr:hypothetical protein [Gammaproteobacteria bacterium]MDH5776767.1 hypothetical protein [Gammaproteobacteria bacterium]